ncbi:MAG TPA: hypothetical protein VKZ72_09880 [Acidimicrobiales bacterium]|nr:hypothetical protein [Acidimicrobiales bacterium]
MTAAIVALGVVVGLLGVLVVGLLRSHADVLRALHDLGIGEDDLAAAGSAEGRRSIGRRTTRTTGEVRMVPGVAAPGDSSSLGRLVDVSGVDPHGGAVHVGIDGSRGMTLLAFLSAGCSTCRDFWRAFGTDEVEQVPGRDTRVVVVTRGPEEESPSEVAALASDRVTTVMSSAAWDDYDVPVSPYFLLIDGSRGVVGEGAGGSWAQVVDLLRKAAADAGLVLDDEGGRPRFTRRDLLVGRDRELRADRELAAAGIEPGSPELYAPLHAVPPGDGPDGEVGAR